MRVFFLTLFVSIVCLANAQAAEEDTAPAEALEVGDAAPNFEATTDADETFKSADVKGKKIVVVYFYPADMTGGCTTQACTYRDSMQEFANHDVLVLGVSGDSAENHRNFKKAHNLNFTLLADPEGKVAKAFGVKTGSGFTNKAVIEGQEIEFPRSLTTSRWTYVIDTDWKIAYKNTSVVPASDPGEVLKVVHELQSDAVEN